MKPYIVIDIETAALPVEQLSAIVPEFEAPKNYRKPEVIEEYKAEKLADWQKSHALHAHRCRIMAAGIMIDGEVQIVEGTEMPILHKLVEVITYYWTSRTIVGHCIYTFDLPMIARRCLIQGVEFPRSVRQALQSYRPPDDIFDTCLAWGLGDRQERISLDHLAWALGVGRKNGKGSDFAQLYVSDRPKALDYVRNDLEITAKVYERLQ